MCVMSKITDFLCVVLGAAVKPGFSHWNGVTVGSEGRLFCFRDFPPLLWCYALHLVLYGVQFFLICTLSVIEMICVVLCVWYDILMP